MTIQIADLSRAEILLFRMEPHLLVVLFKMTDFTWLQRNNNRVAMALGGFLGKMIVTMSLTNG